MLTRVDWMIPANSLTPLSQKREDHDRTEEPTRVPVCRLLEGRGLNDLGLDVYAILLFGKLETNNPAPDTKPEAGQEMKERQGPARGPGGPALVNGGHSRTKIMDTPWRARLSEACLSFVIPPNILGPPGLPSLCFTRQNAMSPALVGKPVAGFMVKWAMETTPSSSTQTLRPRDVRDDGICSKG